MNLSINTPVHLRMASCADRLLTFTRWDCVLRQTPYQLACDGFFHEGIKDYVTCYKCGKTLEYWKHKNFSIECHTQHRELPYPTRSEIWK